MAKFFLYLLLAASVIAGFVIIADAKNYLVKPTFFAPTLLLLLLTTSVIYVYLYKARKQSGFTQLFLLTMVVKVIAYCVYNLMMVLKDKPSAFNNVIFFMVTYFIFTALEIGFLYHKISGAKRP